jgi:hypothetical protein
MADVYRVHKAEHEKWGPARKLHEALQVLRKDLEDESEDETGLYVVKPKGRTWDKDRNWSPEGSLADVAKLLRERFEDADAGQAYLAKPLHKGPESATAIRKEVVFPEPDPPAGANSWIDPLPEIYQFVYAKGRYEGVSYLGVPSCRLTRQGGSWSYHAFNQALDAGITRPDGTQDHKLALQMEKDLTEQFGKHLMFIVTFKEDPTFHFNHDHIQVKPDRSGQTPPCAK